MNVPMYMPLCVCHPLSPPDDREVGKKQKMGKDHVRWV